MSLFSNFKRAFIEGFTRNMTPAEKVRFDKQAAALKEGWRDAKIGMLWMIAIFSLIAIMIGMWVLFAWLLGWIGVVLAVLVSGAVLVIGVSLIDALSRAR